MKITTLIKLFEQGIVDYKKALVYIKSEPDNYRRFIYLFDRQMRFGLCNYFYFIYNEKISDLFTPNKGYYSNLININGYLFGINNYIDSISKRIKFMQDEIKSLNKLLKKGYTHI